MLSIKEVLEKRLTPEQRRAVNDTAREVLCLACAGSGKSRTLAYRIARLLKEDEDPKSIVAFTFTEKAAESIKLRVSQALKEVGIDPTCMGAMYIGTIHSFCQHVLYQMDARYRQYEVLDENRLKLYLLSRYEDLGLKALHKEKDRSRKYNFKVINEVSQAWNTMNDEMISIDDVKRHDSLLGSILEKLNSQMDQDQYIDFSLMIRNVVEALRNDDERAREVVSSYLHLMVDEYQDINRAQEILIEELHRIPSEQGSTLFVVGDDDQAIYGWRGGNVQYIKTFHKKFPCCSIHTLNENFRSTSAIVECAHKFIDNDLGPARIKKNPKARYNYSPRDFRVLWFETREEEAEWVADRIEKLLGTKYVEPNGKVRGLTLSDFAILMRSTRQPDGTNGPPRHEAFTKALKRRGFDYVLEAGGGIFDRPEVRVLKETIDLLREWPCDRESARKHYEEVILNTFPNADFDMLVRTLTHWGRQIYSPGRRRVYIQKMLYDFLHAFRIDASEPNTGAMRDLGVFSGIFRDVESVYVSIDSPGRFHQVLHFLDNIAKDGYDSSTEDILKNQDCVTVSTVHKMKGLEFPVVFVVDVENGRFPKQNKLGKYEGKLPEELIHQALESGSYRFNPDEEARLFYTALTRAERYLYVTGSAVTPGITRRDRKPSRYALALLKFDHPELLSQKEGLPDGLKKHPPQRRINETIVPTSYTEVKQYLFCPRSFQYRYCYGFEPCINEMFGFGITVHTSINKLHEMYSNKAPSGEEAEEVALDNFHLKHAWPSKNPEAIGPYERAKESAARIVRTYAESYVSDFQRRRQVEARFEIPANKAVISGTIDLLLNEDEQGNILEASVIDFKSIDREDRERSQHWTELSLQVQLYAKAAREILGENARTGAVHLLKENERIWVPVDEDAVNAAVDNVEWSVQRIIDGDFPMRPHRNKCEECDFRKICPKDPQQFGIRELPPPIKTPEGELMARAFSEFEGE